jgi:hypothetical protein
MSTTGISQSVVYQTGKRLGGGDTRMGTHYLLDQLSLGRRQTNQKPLISPPPQCRKVDHCLISFKGLGSA